MYWLYFIFFSLNRASRPFCSSITNHEQGRCSKLKNKLWWFEELDTNLKKQKENQRKILIRQLVCGRQQLKMFNVFSLLHCSILKIIRLILLNSVCGCTNKTTAIITRCITIRLNIDWNKSKAKQSKTKLKIKLKATNGAPICTTILIKYHIG